MAHKYLNKIGVKSTDPCVFRTEERDAKRARRFKKERKKYGFDTRETWALGYTSATWLYEHLKVFKKCACINLDYHKFQIPVLYDIPEGELPDHIPEGHTRPTEYTTQVIEEHTQGEAIDYMTKYLKQYIRSETASDWDEEMKGFEALQCAFRIYAEVIGAMWW